MHDPKLPCILIIKASLEGCAVVRSDKKGLLWGLGLLVLVFCGQEIEKTLADNARIIKKIPTTHRIVALTFDDGPSRKTPEILRILNEKHVKATFFVLGEMVEHFPQYVIDEIAKGHEIGNHGYSHVNLHRASQAKMENEIERTDRLLNNTFGLKCKLFRPPGGVFDHNVLEAAARHGYTLVLWSVDSQDWAASGERIIRNTLRNAKPGGIILFHDGIESIPTSRVLPTIIDRLREEGYEFVTVGELLRYYEGNQDTALINKYHHGWRSLAFKQMMELTLNQCPASRNAIIAITAKELQAHLRDSVLS